jgi:hypothetical protein
MSFTTRLLISCISLQISEPYKSDGIVKTLHNFEHGYLRTNYDFITLFRIFSLKTFFEATFFSVCMKFCFTCMCSSCSFVSDWNQYFNCHIQY